MPAWNSVGMQATWNILEQSHSTILINIHAGVPCCRCALLMPSSELVLPNLLPTQLEAQFVFGFVRSEVQRCQPFLMKLVIELRHNISLQSYMARWPLTGALVTDGDGVILGDLWCICVRNGKGWSEWTHMYLPHWTPWTKQDSHPVCNSLIKPRGRLH